MDKKKSKINGFLKSLTTQSTKYDIITFITITDNLTIHIHLFQNIFQESHYPKTMKIKRSIQMDAFTH